MLNLFAFSLFNVFSSVSYLHFHFWTFFHPSLWFVSSPKGPGEEVCIFCILTLRFFCIFIPFILILHCIGSLVSFALCLHRRQWWEEELWSLSCHFREPIQRLHCCTVFNSVWLPEYKQMVHRTTHCVEGPMSENQSRGCALLQYIVILLDSKAVFFFKAPI